MSLWARGIWTVLLGAFLFVLCAFTVLGASGFLIGAFGRAIALVILAGGTLVAVGLIILGVVQTVRGLLATQNPN